jgi:hypothetical protein
MFLGDILSENNHRRVNFLGKMSRSHFKSVFVLINAWIDVNKLVKFRNL